MVRGVNRRVVEIKRCNSDYFDRAFLVVKDEKIKSDAEILSASAEIYLGSILKEPKKKGKHFLKILSYIIAIVIGFLIAVLVL